MIMFTTEVYLRLLERYAEALWPAPLVAAALAVAMLYLVLRPRPWSDRPLLGLLAVLQWLAALWHMAYFATVNWAAWGFGAALALQGLLFAWGLVSPRPLAFRFRPDLFGWVGLALAVAALAVYPLAAWLADQAWPRALLLVLAPVPTVAFTLGLLIMAEACVPRRLLAIPALWCLVWGLAAWTLALPEDLAFCLAGLAAVALALRKNRMALSRPPT